MFGKDISITFYFNIFFYEKNIIYLSYHTKVNDIGKNYVRRDKNKFSIKKIKINLDDMKFLGLKLKFRKNIVIKKIFFSKILYIQPIT